MINNSNNQYNKEEEIISIEKNNINMLILCRSLYILKKKFEKNKDIINKIYLKYQNDNNNNNNNLLKIPLENLNEVINDIMNISEFNIIVYKEFNDLITADLLNNENIIKKILILLNTFINEKVDYYNDLYLKKRKTEEKFKLNEKNNMNNNINNDNEKLINKDEINENENNKNNENIENDEEKILKKEEEKNNKNEEELKNLNEENNKDLENNKENNNEQIENVKNDDNNENNQNENEKNNTENIKKEINLNLNDQNSLNINNNLLFCDTIPLIIADFIQNHKNFAIISKNDDFNEETKKLFDNEIIKKIDLIEKSNPSENKKIKLKNLLYNLNSITNHIKIYQNLLVTKSKEGTNLNHLYEMIKKLKIQKSKIQNEINSLQNNNNNNNNENLNKSNSNLNKTRSISNHSKIKPKKNKNILRKTALTEIFYFYSKQHNKINSLTTFENIQNKEQNLDLSEFSKFCIEFKLTIKMNKIVELFKKNTSDSKKMSFNEFVNILEKLSIEINNEKKKILENRIKLLNLKINEIEENEKNKLNKLNIIINNNKEKKEEQKNILPKIQTNKKPNNNKNKNNNKIILYNNKEELSNEISQLLLDLEKLKNKNFTVLLEELYDYLEIDSPQKYRNKMKGFLLPFSTHDKFSREQPINIVNNNRNRLNSQNDKKIREILINKYNEKLNAKKLKEKKEKEILFEKKVMKFQEKNKLLSEHLKGKKNYMNIMKEKEEIKKKKKNVFTWDDIEKLNSDNILLNNKNNNDENNNENNKNIRNSIEEIFNIKDNSIVNDSSEDDIY